MRKKGYGLIELDFKQYYFSGIPLNLSFLPSAFPPSAPARSICRVGWGLRHLDDESLIRPDPAPLCQATCGALAAGLSASKHVSDGGLLD